MIYNASYGSCIEDACYAFLSSKAVITAEALKIKEEWDKLLEGHGLDAKILQYCHSAGAIQVRNALENFPEIRNRIIVVAIAPAQIVPRKLCFDSYNYASESDPVPLARYALGTSPDEEDELMILERHPDAKTLFDHDFLSPTFTKVKRRHLTEFKEKYDK